MAANVLLCASFCEVALGFSVSMIVRFLHALYSQRKSSTKIAGKAARHVLMMHRIIEAIKLAAS